MFFEFFRFRPTTVSIFDFDFDVALGFWFDIVIFGNIRGSLGYTLFFLAIEATIIWNFVFVCINLHSENGFWKLIYICVVGY